jgi:hypothetical protein
MNLNLKITAGRLLVMLAVIVGAVNLHWYMTLEPTTAEVIRSEGPCYRRNKATVCDFQIRYATGAGAIIVTTFGAGSLLPIGKPLAGLYHPNTPVEFHPHDASDWMLRPILIFLIGLACWATALHERGRKAEPDNAASDGGAAMSNWVTRAYRRVAEAGAPRQRGPSTGPARTRNSRSPG